MENRQLRSIPCEFQTRDDDDQMIIEGYFAVFDSVYQIWDDMSESIAPGAFSSSLSGDVRALINHDSTLVLGRTSAHTLELKEDSRGLWGRIVVNPKDSDARELREGMYRSVRLDLTSQSRTPNSAKMGRSIGRSEM